MGRHKSTPKRQIVNNTITPTPTTPTATGTAIASSTTASSPSSPFSSFAQPHSLSTTTSVLGRRSLSVSIEDYFAADAAISDDDDNDDGDSDLNDETLFPKWTPPARKKHAKTPSKRCSHPAIVDTAKSRAERQKRRTASRKRTAIIDDDDDDDDSDDDLVVKATRSARSKLAVESAQSASDKSSQTAVANNNNDTSVKTNNTTRNKDGSSHHKNHTAQQQQHKSGREHAAEVLQHRLKHLLSPSESRKTPCSSSSIGGQRRRGVSANDHNDNDTSNSIAPPSSQPLEDSDQSDTDCHDGNSSTDNNSGSSGNTFDQELHTRIVSSMPPSTFHFRPYVTRADRVARRRKRASLEEDHKSNSLVVVEKQQQQQQQPAKKKRKKLSLKRKTVSFAPTDSIPATSSKKKTTTSKITCQLVSFIPTPEIRIWDNSSSNNGDDDDGRENESQTTANKTKNTKITTSVAEDRTKSATATAAKTTTIIVTPAPASSSSSSIQTSPKHKTYDDAAASFQSKDLLLVKEVTLECTDLEVPASFTQERIQSIPVRTVDGVVSILQHVIQLQNAPSKRRPRRRGKKSSTSPLSSSSSNQGDDGRLYSYLDFDRHNNPTAKKNKRAAKTVDSQHDEINQRMLSMMGQAVLHGTIVLSLEPNPDAHSVTLAWRLDLKTTMKIAHPDTISLHRAHNYDRYLNHPFFTKRKTKKHGNVSVDCPPPACLYFGLFVLLGPNHVLIQLLLNSSKSKQATACNTVSASRVYNLVDNVQYNRVLATSKIRTRNGKDDSAGTRNTIKSTIPGLVPTLRPYQQAAVSWMVRQERGEDCDSSAEKGSQNDGSNIDNREWEVAWYVLTAEWQMIPLPMYRNTYLASTRMGSTNTAKTTSKKRSIADAVAYICPFQGGCGWWARSYEQAFEFSEASQEDQTKPRGGILAESMGLGKTVEVLACVLANKAPLAPAKTATTTMTTAKPKISQGGMTTPERQPQNDHGSLDSQSPVLPSPTGVTEFESFNRPSSPPTESSTEKEAATNERWWEFDDARKKDELGVCICGRNIKFVKNSKRQADIVLCEQCDQPMHASCANLTALECRGLPLVNLRRRFYNDVMPVRTRSANSCPCCAASKMLNGKQNLVQSRATLIVTPPAILNQWEREIKRHTRVAGEGMGSQHRSLKVYVYPGVRNLTKAVGKVDPEKSKLIHADVLADADIVLTTFDSLMGDLGHSSDNPYAVAGDESGARTLRYRKQYRVVPSPLTSIRWWRVCLDEAQRIDNPTASSARMALQLQAQHRWCVSGTPIGKGKLDDLYGLLLFLNVKPFHTKEWFSKCFLNGAADRSAEYDDRLKHLLQNILWRSTKASEQVKAEMGIPEQVEKKAWLELSSVERHFYQRQLETTLNMAGDAADMAKTKTSTNKSFSKKRLKQLDMLSNQMHRLRAACLHPQVGSGALERIKRRRIGGAGGAGQGLSTNSAYSRILTMDQILDRLIDDAKLKCEEAQRLASMHTNAMAALSRLKVEGKARGQIIPETDIQLLSNSCKLYTDSLQCMEENSVPGSVVGEAILGGSTGFRSSHRVVRDGRAQLEWQIKNAVDWTKRKTSLWSTIEFDNASKRITQIKVKPVPRIPAAIASENKGTSWKLIQPKKCTLQVSSSAVGGVFVDVASIDILGDKKMNPNTWIVRQGFRTNKSKAWRILIESFHDVDDGAITDITADDRLYCGINIELFEADIASDPLQRLHALHNASLAFSKLLDDPDLDAFGESSSNDESGWHLSCEETKAKLSRMKTESKMIESLYIGSVLPLHHESQRQLKAAITAATNSQAKLAELSAHSLSSKSKVHDCFDDEWWVDLVLLYSRFGSGREKDDICQRVYEDLNSALEGSFDRHELRAHPFPKFTTVDGLFQALSLRKELVRKTLPAGSFMKCLHDFTKFSTEPDEMDVMESAQCARCKRDWTWTGPMCRHCQRSVEFLELIPDRLFMLVLESIWNFAKGSNRGGRDLCSAKSAAKVEARAKQFFEVIDAEKKARSAAERAWRVHLDLLNDLDELSMSKRSMRLVVEGEDLSQLMEAELNAVIHPIDLRRNYMEHSTKQAMALAQLRRHKSTLRYLKHQNNERSENRQKVGKGDLAGATAKRNVCGIAKASSSSSAAAVAAATTTTTISNGDDTCIVCLETMTGNRAVLLCGHSFCYTPCLERLMSRAPGSHTICCPMRCPTRTRRNEVLISSNKRTDDGTRASRKVNGSWGTKVTKIVADIMDVADLGDKSIVFSMWEDMLDVVQAALHENGVSFVRATSLSKMGESTKRFCQQDDCSVLLLNIKNGAEGLTLTDATHIFMVEPVLNAALDLQAINRIHRIGQKEKTYVHRYIVKDTIEVKIDKLRMERSSQGDDDMMVLAGNDKKAYKAGGIDGGFESRDELLSILTNTDVTDDAGAAKK